MRSRLFLTYVLTATLPMGSASAFVDVISEEAGISIHASADGESNSVNLNITSSDPLPYQESRIAENVTQTVRGEGEAALPSYSANNSNGLSVSAGGSFDVSAVASGSSEALAIGVSGFSVRFDVERPAPYTAVGSLFKQNSFLLGEDESLAYAQLEKVDPNDGSTTVLWNISADTGAAPINVDSSLDGNSQYILTVQALGWVLAVAPDVLSKANNGSFQIDFDLMEVPAGDANLDGDVDLSDLGALATNYGATAGASWSSGDFDYDGDVDLVDLGSLATNYSSGTANALADFHSLTSVPEPRIAMLIASVVPGLFTRYRVAARVP